MKVRLYNAISTDGFIAENNGDTSWVAEVDWESFKKHAYDTKHLISGRRTYDEMLELEKEDFNNSKVKYYVLTSKPNKKTHFSDPKQITATLKDKGISEAMLIGGGKASAAFLEAGLIDEIIISVHPLVLGDGIRLFESDEYHLDLERIKTEELDDGLVQITYEVKKS